MSLRECAASTRKSYLATLTDLATYHRRSPDTLDPTQVQRYLLSLPLSKTEQLCPAVSRQPVSRTFAQEHHH
jgi:hypothetical protein